MSTGSAWLDSLQGLPDIEIMHQSPNSQLPVAQISSNDLLAYVLQDDAQNRLTPRVIDIAYTAFMQAKKPNDEDGGASDWFTDTKPVVMKAIEKLRKDLSSATVPQVAQSVPSDEQIKKLEYELTNRYWLGNEQFPAIVRDVFNTTASNAGKAAQPSAEAIRTAARRYEIMRKLNVPQFAELYRRSIAGKGRFDDLVDQLGIT